MKIKIDKELNSNNYLATIGILELEVGDYLQGIHDFGEDTINFGGKIIDEDDTTVLATIADRNLKITDIAKSPMKQAFSSVQFGDIAEKTANRWVENTVNKIDKYAKEVSSKVDNFTETAIIDV